MIKIEQEIKIPNLKYDLKKIDDIVFYDKNPKSHDKIQIDKLKKIIQEVGFREPVLLESENKPILVCGHGRVLAARQLGMKELPVVYADDLSEKQIKAYLRISSISSLLNPVRPRSAPKSINSSKSSFKNWLIQSLSATLLFPILEVNMVDGGVEEVEADDPNEIKTDIVLGEVFELGTHRLMCGDSTSKEAVDKLMNGEKADMVFTDPPYGLGGYGGRNNMDLKGDDEDVQKFYDCIPMDVKEVYVWGNAYNMLNLKTKPRDVIVWKKNNFGLGRGYRGQYELCFYWGEFKGSDSDVWEISKDTNYEHPTQKPVDLAARAFKNSYGNNVLDLFGGSGSTLIACEQLNRKCYMMEIDPKYVQVIINRWQKLTGKKAIKT